VAFAALRDARESDVVAGSVEEPLVVLFAQARTCQCSDAVSRACIEKARSEETAHECRAGELPVAGKLFEVVRARIELQSSKSSGGSRSLTLSRLDCRRRQGEAARTVSIKLSLSNH
jgi:hypothetical protein